MGTAIKHPVLDWAHLSTLTLSPERQSARM